MEELLLNKDIIELKESSTLWLNTLVKEMRQKGECVYHLGFGQSPFPVHPKIVEALRESSHEKDYLPTLGLLKLREKISEFYKEQFNYKFNPDNIIIGPGSKELLFQALFALDGTVIIPAPSWVSYGPQVNIRGKHISRILTKLENNYKIRPFELENLCQTLTSKQKILIINSPNNPTGTVYSDREIKDIVKVCKKYNVIVISDEIYAQIDFTGNKKKGFFHYYPERTIVTAGLSKSHSAGGYRLGFLASSKEMSSLIKCLASLVSETFSAVSAPIQNAGVMAYSGDSEIMEYIGQCSKIHRASGYYLYHRFISMGFLLPKPGGAFYLMPSFENFRKKLQKKYQIFTSDDLSKTLLSEIKVAVLPATDFYLPSDWLCCRVATVDYNGAKIYQESLKSKVLTEDFIEKNAPNLKLACDAIQNFLA